MKVPAGLLLPALVLPALLLSLGAAAPLFAHVGSPDIFFAGDAGPYRLLVTIRPPVVIPGAADIEVRSLAPDVRQVHIVPLRLVAGRQFAPVPDLAQPSKQDPQFFTGTLWLMATGSWQVRVDVDGDRGPGTLSVPVPALSTRVLTMRKTMAAILIPLALLLCLGIVGIAGASAREARLEPGVPPDARDQRRARISMASHALLMAAILWFGNQWWNSEAGRYGRYVYKPLQLRASVEDGGRLVLRLDDPGWLDRRTDDLLPDHNHLMHLFVIRIPEMDRVWHLHPDLHQEHGDNGAFVQTLPDMPAGRYALYGDIVHAYGIGETAATEISLPDTAGQPLAGDDAAGTGPALTKADYNRSVTVLPDAYQMVWDREPAPLRARQPYLFRFRLQDAAGRPAQDMQLYMGMPGHAAFVAADRSVFAHVHPSGSVPMASLALAQQPHASHSMASASGPPAEVSFPYGFPKPGAYRIFVQMKRAGRIVTGVFSANVEN